MTNTFLRRLSSHETWVDFRQQLAAGSAAVPATLIAELEDPDGMSVFEIRSEANIPRIVAALTMARSRIDNFYGVIIPRKLIQSQGFKETKTPQNGFVFDQAMKAQHYDVTKGPNGNTEAFAKKIASCTEVFFSGVEVVAYINAELKAARLARSDVYRDCQNVEPSLKVMLSHWRKSYLQLSYG